MLSRKAIAHFIEKGLIEIDPAPARIGPNSIDLHLGDSLKRYAPAEYGPPVGPGGFRMDYEKPSILHNRVKVVDPVDGATYYAIDPKNPPPLIDVPKLADGRWLLVPCQFYIGVTHERTKTIGVVPHLAGRSTCGRLSIEAHKTAGVGDNGFNGRWTLEIEVTEPVLVTPGDRLFQVYFEPCWGVDLFKFVEGLKESDSFALLDFLETEDLYGKEGDGHHYQHSKDAQGAAVLDD